MAMNKKQIVSGLVLWIFSCCMGFAQINDLERVSPESEGLSSTCIQEYFDEMMHLEKGNTHGIMILRHGKVIGELYPQPIQADYSHTLYSASKTLVAIAIGIAIDEQRLHISDQVISFFPHLLPDTLSEGLSQMTIQHLLTMCSGIQPDWNLRNHQTQWIQQLLRKEVKQPGSQFQYDSMVSYLLSAILQQVTGKKLLDYLKEKIFNPMHITQVEWEESPEGINTGGWGLYMQVESMAKVGQLLLNHGKWNGEQLVSSKWVDEMMSIQKKTGMLSDYGYQIWYQAKTKTYRADGAFGQYIIISPSTDMVVAITQDNKGNGVYEQLLVYDKIFSKVSDQKLLEGEAYTQLKEKRYTLPVVQGEKNSSHFEEIKNKTITLDPQNKLEWEKIQIETENDLLRINVITNGGKQYSILAGYQQWIDNTTTVCPPYSIKALGRFNGISRHFHVAACYGWEEATKLTIRVLFPNWISGADVKIE